MSSHILQEIQATVDRIIIIDEGEIVADGTNEELMSNFMGNVLLTMETNLSTDEHINELAEKVPAVEISSFDAIPNGHKIHMEYKREEDPREKIFKYAVEKGWILLSMTPHSANLEDIFRNLTMKGGNDA